MDNTYIDITEVIIKTLCPDQDVMVRHSENGHFWQFPYGTVTLFVQLTGTQEDDSFTVWSPVLNLPVNQPSNLFEKLLRLNWLTTFETHFAIHEDEVVVVASRSVNDLSAAELARLITQVATLADELDEPLKEEFSA